MYSVRCLKYFPYNVCSIEEGSITGNHAQFHLISLLMDMILYFIGEVWFELRFECWVIVISKSGQWDGKRRTQDWDRMSIKGWKGGTSGPCERNKMGFFLFSFINTRFNLTCAKLCKKSWLYFACILEHM